MNDDIRAAANRRREAKGWAYSDDPGGTQQRVDCMNLADAYLAVSPPDDGPITNDWLASIDKQCGDDETLEWTQYGEGYQVDFTCGNGWCEDVNVKTRRQVLNLIAALKGE